MMAAGVDVYRDAVCASRAAASRWTATPAALLGAVILAFAISLVPVSIDLGDPSESEINPAMITLTGVNVHKCEANAVPPAVAGGVAMVETLASAAGVSASEFVYSCGVIIAGGTGLNVAKNGSISAANTLTDNLEAWIETEELPYWGELSDSEQTSWGSKDNYNAYRFGRFMSAFGLGTTVDRYYGSGGNNFEMTEVEQSRLMRIGNICGRFIQENPVPWVDINDCLVSVSSIFNKQEIGIDYDVTYTKDGIELPLKYIDVNVQDATTGRYVSPTNWFFGAFSASYAPGSFFVPKAGIETVGLTSYSGTGNPPSHWRFSMNYKTEFQYKIANKSFINMNNGGGSAALYGGNVGNYLRRDMYLFPDGTDVNSAGNKSVDYDQFSDTPSSIVDGLPEDSQQYDGNLKAPEQLGPSTTYDDLKTSEEVDPDTPPIPRPDNGFNPDNQSSTPEWKGETKQNITPILNIHADKLFPFCLLYDISRLMTKMQSLGVMPSQNLETSQLSPQDAEIASEYLVVRMPVDGSIIGIEEANTIELELAPLHDLLLMVRPAFQILLVVGLLLSVILFWKGVITG